MDGNNDKSPIQGGGFPPPPSSGRYSQFSPPRNRSSFNVVSDSSDSTTHFSNDFSRMHDNPPKNLGHRRAHSEILTLPDDINFDSDLGIVGGFDGPSFSDDTEEDLLSIYLDIDKFNLSSASSSSNFPLGEPSSSIAADAPSSSFATPTGDNVFSGPNERPTRVRHQHSQSMDGSTLIKPELLMSGPEEGSAADSKKAMSAAKLAELALVDPKRAKRIWANRQSAARSKERKMRYIAELERKVQTLQTEATTLSAQLTLLQRDTNGITAENSELKLRLQTTEQQVQLQDALNDALKEEIQHLKAVTGQMANGGPMLNFQSFGGGSQQYYPNNNAKMHSLLAAQQFQQLHINPHLQKKQQQLQQQQQHQQQLQLQRQQLHLHHLEQQHQQSGELRARVTMPSPRIHIGNSSDTNPSGTRDSGE